VKSKCYFLNFQHIAEKRHIEASKIYDVTATLDLLPQLSQCHVEALDKLLAEVEKEFGLSESDLRERVEISEKIGSLVNIDGSVLPE